MLLIFISKDTGQGWTLLAQPGPEVIKLFSCSPQLSMKFKMLISIKFLTNSALLVSDKLIMLFFLFLNVKMPTVVGILTFMSR